MPVAPVRDPLYRGYRFPPRSSPRWSEIDPILNSELDKLWSGEQPPKQVADSIKLLIDSLLKA